ncbi:ABC transporter substrate-binding protein [Ferdinandcohnia quinoae]|uniref:ABC transporter substrate-binding protein n=1 Tax=Fredinandcohnia quinoae TaxID=2918902 RepID=A0AAW5E9E2_9BACI|nr:ABC transporter substrate-binding protein [Fredinandcohnia sp. SECRCQ15]MCH1625728.1 ABC transporter substrate-binding protein [Fredinandcohnia sp. SECRCQ15]
MKERYFTLRSYLMHFEKDKQYDLKLEDVDALWFCSRKNTKRILKQLVSERLLAYQPGRGRGNVSKISYFTSFQEEMETLINDYVEEGKLDKIAEILRLPIPKGWVANSSKEISELLGLKHDYSESRDILHTFKVREITTLDPLRVSLALETHLIEYLGDTLVRYDKERDCFIPHIAHHFYVDPTERIWTFYLRKGVYFHNRENVTSYDVASTIERIKKGNPSYSWLAGNIEKVECPHSHKIEIHLVEPNPFFLRYLSAPIFCILPANVEFNEFEWIGTGPFKLKERTEYKMVLQANDYYFKERPLIDEIHFYHVTKEAARMIYLAGKESTTDIEPSKYRINDSGVYLLSFNLQRKNIIQQHDFREAIYHVFNVQKMENDLQMDIFEASSLDIERSRSETRSPQKVAALIESSGYKGETLNLFCFNKYPVLREAQWLQNEASKFGISLNICPISYSEFIKEGVEKEIDILMMGLSLSFDKHLAFSYAFKNKVLLFNRLFSKEIEEYVQRKLYLFELEEEKDKRTIIMEEIEQYLKKELAMFFLYHPIVTRFMDPNIKDVESHSFGHIDYTKLWIPS